MYRYVKHQKLLLKTHPQFNEKWVQEKIAEDSSILGIGELILKDKERNQPGAGRLDLLFQDPHSNLRYEVEIQLNAIQIGEQIALIFTVVLDHRLGLAPEEEEEQEVTDRAYWEKRSSKTTVYMAGEVLGLLKTFDQELALKYNKFYISVSKDNKPFNFVIFRPKKASLGVEPKLKKAEEIEIMLDSAGLNVLEYDTRNHRYRIRFSKDEFQKHQRLLKEILGRAFKDFNGDMSGE